MNKSILSSPPQISPVENIKIPVIREDKGYHDIPIYEIRKPGCNVVKVELVFLAGRPFEHNKMVASTCADLLREGAGPWSSKQLANYVGYYGASFEVHASLDTITIQLVCLKKYLGLFIKPFEYVLNNPRFKKKELKSYVKRRSQKLLIDLNKNDVISYRQLTEAIFGSDHPYGYNSSEELYKKLSREDLIQHFESTIHAKNCLIFAAGDIDDEGHKYILEISSRVRQALHMSSVVNFPIHSFSEKINRYPGSAEQSSIKVGRRMFPRTHPDYLSMTFLNTLMGGFFGSRLVTILREDLGLTYGIFSSIDSFLNDGIFMISTEVANENVQKSLAVIYEQCSRLQNEEVGEEEMSIVRNYTMGLILNLFDGPFNSIRAIKSLALSRIPISEVKSLIYRSQSITPQEIKSLAQNYLNRNDFWEVVVGS